MGGKNLLKIVPAETSSQKKGIDTTYNETTGEISFSGTTTASYPWLSCADIDNTIPSGTKLVFSTTVSKTYTIYCRLYASDNSYETATIRPNALNGSITLTKNIIRLVIMTDTASGVTLNDSLFLQLEKGTVATRYSPYVSNPIELSENDKIWNNNGIWQLNDTAITDTYLLTQLQALDNIELYEDLCYVDWVGIEKPTMNLLYSGTEDLGIKYIITEDGKKIRTDWRKLGRRKKWKMK